MVIGKVASQVWYTVYNRTYFVRVSMKEKRKYLLSRDRKLVFSRLLKDFEGKRIKLTVRELK